MKTVLASAIVSVVVSVIATLTTAALLAPAAANAQEGVVRAQEFFLVGSDGSTRARLFERTNPATGSTGGFLTLIQAGQARLNLAYGGRGPAAAEITLRDGDAARRIQMAVATDLAGNTEGDLTRIGVLDRNGHVRLAMGVDSDGTPFILLLDGAGQPTWSVGAPLKNVLKAGQ